MGLSVDDPAWQNVREEVVRVRGLDVRVLRCDPPGDGDAPRGLPQLLVHGLGASAVTWAEVMSGLATHGPVVAVDLPGCGGTPLRGPATMTAYARFVVDLADALDWPRFELHGNSMGGLIGTIVAARHPERVAGLVLVSPALPPSSPLRLLVPSRATIDGMVPIAASSLASSTLGVLGTMGPALGERRNRDLLRLIFDDPDAVRPALVDLMAAELADADPEVAEERRRALLSSLWSITRLWTSPRGVWRAIDRVQSPTLLLGGTADALVPARVLRQVLARRRDWEGAVIDDRRHALMLEDPADYLRRVADWRRGAVAAA